MVSSDGGDAGDDDDEAPVLADAADVALCTLERAVGNAHEVSHRVGLRGVGEDLDAGSHCGGDYSENLNLHVRDRDGLLAITVFGVQVHVAELFVTEADGGLLVRMDEHIRRHDLLGIVLNAQFIQRLGNPGRPPPEHLYRIPMLLHTKTGADFTAGP